MALPFLGQNLLSEGGRNRLFEAETRVFERQGKKGVG